MFPHLTAEDIDVRASRVTEKRVELLLYKNARCDMRMLDEAVGPMNWQRSHQVVGGVNYCTVSIRGEGGAWVSKQDCGTPGTFEADKSASSDAFKRACFNWGIGRELYTAPHIAFWAEQDGDTLCETRQRDGRWTTYDRFSVSRVGIERHRITELEVFNDTQGVTVFSWACGALEAAKARLWDAIKAHAAKTGEDPRKLAEGAMARPDRTGSPEWYEMAAQEFEG